jgi:hypothetical protein
MEEKIKQLLAIRENEAQLRKLNQDLVELIRIEQGRADSIYQELANEAKSANRIRVYHIPGDRVMIIDPSLFYESVYDIQK